MRRRCELGRHGFDALPPCAEQRALARDRDGELIREIARTYNVSHSTISRLAA
jgi:hypothetical protein